jgi:prepilin-type N-terminal cleavage/methylation domain-containing protein
MRDGWIASDGENSKAVPHGFSLVELLAAITVISIMAAMLPPALTKAVANARQVACGNQFK